MKLVIIDPCMPNSIDKELEINKYHVSYSIRSGIDLQYYNSMTAVVYHLSVLGLQN